MRVISFTQPATIKPSVSAGLRVISFLWPATLFLAACSPKVVTQDRPVIVKTPVPAPCATKRPTPPAPLKDRADWIDLDVKQKAALVARQAIELRTYGEQINAATIACKEK